MSARSIALTLAALTAAALTGCSSSGGGGTVALADIPLKTGEVPSTFVAKAHDTSDDSDDAADQKQIVACIGGNYRNTRTDKVREVNSQDFTAKDDSSITSSATLYKSADDITNDTKLFADPKASSCFAAQAKKQLATALPAGAKIGTLKVDLVAGSGGGPKNVVATLTASVPLTVQGQSVTVYIDSAFITGNKVEADVTATGFGKRIDASVRSKAVEAVAGRAAKA